ncbi:MAG: hypothetical protein HOP29_15265 [Phycisphaerales bacterium]|nr:hypothetical protein [Phycisphaerales bacterium]
MTQPESLADIVPASAGLFLEINPLESPDGSSRSRNALMLIEMVVGPVQNPDLPGNDWRRILLDALGLQSGDQARELLKHQIALVAPSWDRLGEAMIVIRHRPDDRLLNDVFRPDDADSLDARGNVAVFRTRTNLSAATDGACLVISQRRDPASLYRGTVKRMLGDGPPALSADAGFDEQIRALPPGRDITVYVRPAATPDAASPPTFLSSVLSSMAAGVYLRDDYIHFAFSGTGARAAVDRPSATLSVGDLKELPLTTVAAWCTPIDVSSLFRALLDRHVGADAPAYVQFFKTMLNVDEFDERVLSRLGPGAMVVWDQDLGTGSELPQLAVILKAQDAPQCASRMADTVQLVVNWQDIRERDRSGRRLQLSRSDYLGTTLFEVAFPNAGGDADRHHLLSAVRPAFAAVGESLVIAFSADHVRNIIDARFGLAPTLEALPGMASTLRVQDTEPFLMGVAQPALAAQIVGTWLRQTDRGPMRWLMDDDASPFRRVSASADRPFTLGIGTQPGPRPGTVHVARVYDGGRAAGQLTPGDTIVGVNGQLLGLDAASRDLRRMVGRFPDGGSWVFRVERGDAVVDVTIPAPQPAVAGIDPTTALRQLQALFRRIDFGSIRATETSPDRFTAHLTLRFTDDPNAS